MATHLLDNTLALLTRTPAAFDALLRGLPDFWIEGREATGGWNPREVMGHLVSLERCDWMTRAAMILETGESLPFSPVDREAHLRENAAELGTLLDAFATLRAENLRRLRGWSLTPEQLELRGRHPVYGPVTLSQLLAAWAAHDMTHLHQLARILAGQYREQVGPWSSFLGVLHCTAHGA